MDVIVFRYWHLIKRDLAWEEFPTEWKSIFDELYLVLGGRCIDNCVCNYFLLRLPILCFFFFFKSPISLAQLVLSLLFFHAINWKLLSTYLADRCWLTNCIDTSQNWKFCVSQMKFQSVFRISSRHNPRSLSIFKYVQHFRRTINCLLHNLNRILYTRWPI